MQCKWKAFILKVTSHVCQYTIIQNFTMMEQSMQSFESAKNSCDELNEVEKNPPPKLNWNYSPNTVWRQIIAIMMDCTFLWAWTAVFLTRSQQERVMCTSYFQRRRRQNYLCFSAALLVLTFTLHVPLWWYMAMVGLYFKVAGIYITIESMALWGMGRVSERLDPQPRLSQEKNGTRTQKRVSES